MKVERGPEPGTLLLRLEPWEREVLELTLNRVGYTQQYNEGWVDLTVQQVAMIDDLCNGLRAVA